MLQLFDSGARPALSRAHSKWHRRIYNSSPSRASCTARSDRNCCAPAGNLILLAPKSVNTYSNLAVQFGAKVNSTPAPNVQPVRHRFANSVVPATAVPPSGVPASCAAGKLIEAPCEAACPIEEPPVEREPMRPRIVPEYSTVSVKLAWSTVAEENLWLPLVEFGNETSASPPNTRRDGAK